MPDSILRKSIGGLTSWRGAHGAARVAVVCAATLAFAVSTTARADDDALTKGAADYKPFAVEHIGDALAGAKALQAAVEKGDVKAAQAAWIKSRKGWEAVEPITGEFFPDLDDAIDAWPDAKKGYHAVEAPLFSGKLSEIKAPVKELVANLTTFSEKLGAADYNFTPQGLLNGATGLAYEVGENKSKGGESPYAGTSLIDMQENVEGIEAVYKLTFEKTLEAKDDKLADKIDDQIEKVEDLVDVKDLKQLDQSKLNEQAEQLAVLLQDAAEPLGLEKPTLGD